MGEMCQPHYITAQFPQEICSRHRSERGTEGNTESTNWERVNGCYRADIWQWPTSLLAHKRNVVTTQQGFKECSVHCYCVWERCRERDAVILNQDVWRQGRRYIILIHCREKTVPCLEGVFFMPAYTSRHERYYFRKTICTPALIH